MIHRETTTLGELISTLYEQHLATYGDEDLASVATAATINDLLNEALAPDPRQEADAA